MIVRVRDVQVSGVVERDPPRPSQLREGSEASVAAQTWASGSRIRGDYARRSHLADAVIAGIRDVQVPGGVERGLPRLLQLRAGGRTGVAIVASGPVARHGKDCPAGYEPAHTIPEMLRDPHRA